MFPTSAPLHDPDMIRRAYLAMARAGLAEDFSMGPDITTLTTVAPRPCTAVISTRQAGVVSGLDAMAVVADVAGEFLEGDASLRIDALTNNGDQVQAGDVLARVSGNVQTILQLERTMLNICLLYTSPSPRD